MVAAIALAQGDRRGHGDRKGEERERREEGREEMEKKDDGGHRKRDAPRKKNQNACNVQIVSIDAG